MVGREVLDYWDDHVMGSQFLAGEGLEIGTREYFDRLHPIMFRHEYLIPLIHEEAPPLKGKRLLEVGCGMGFDSLEWAKQGVDVTAIDLATSAVSMARLHFGLRDEQAELAVGSALDLPFPDNSFDARAGEYRVSGRGCAGH